VEPRVGLDAVVNKKYLCPCRESIPCRSASSLVTMLTDYQYIQQSVTVLHSSVIGFVGSSREHKEKSKPILVFS